MKLFGLLLLAACLPIAHGQTASRFTISTLAGTGAAGFSGDGGSATAALLTAPYGIAINSSGAVLITDSVNQRVRQISGSTISSIAGNGSKAYAGDGGQATAASLAAPAGVAVDSSGNVFVADSAGAVIRKITSAGVISTVAGNNTKGAGYFGDSATATNAQLNTPLGLAVDSSGAVYIADMNNHRIRKLGTDGNISTVAGNGGAAYFGDGGRATSASLNRPLGVAVDAAGNIYIADNANHRVRKVAKDGTISTFAGTGTPGYSGDLGPATAANLRGPTSVAVDAGGNVFICDSENHRIRRVSTSGTITTVAGTGAFGYTGDGGLATDSKLFFPVGVAVDKNGNVFVTDTQNNVVRQLTPIAGFALAPKVSGVIGAGSFGGFTAVAPGSWIEIYGTDLAVTARQWSGSDFTGRTSPTILDGTSVNIGGIAAPVAYVSGGQVNVLVPQGVGAGAQTLTVTTLVGTSASFSLQVETNRAGLFAPQILNLGGKQYAGAVLTDGAYAVPAGSVANVNSRPAKAGETISIFGVGFGPVTPDTTAGQIAQGSTSLTGSLQVTLGGVPATVTYKGLAPGTVGVYQINLIVPAGVTGDAALAFTLNGVAGRQALFVAVGN